MNGLLIIAKADMEGYQIVGVTWYNIGKHLQYTIKQLKPQKANYNTKHYSIKMYTKTFIHNMKSLKGRKKNKKRRLVGGS